MLTNEKIPFPSAALLRGVWVAGCMGLAMLAGCTPGADAPSWGKGGDRPGGAIKFSACRVKGVDTEVRCATFAVPENRGNPQGKKIDLNIVVLPAEARKPLRDPIMLFAGGPGQAASDLAPQALAIFGDLAIRRDIILIDQRGTGKSNGLFCRTPDENDERMANPGLREALLREATVECREKLAQVADLTQYTTTIAMQDFDDVRQALGVEQLNLWGGSYGTRAAMEYLRRYPQHVRSLVLDGVAPPSMVLPTTFARDAAASLQKMLAACEADQHCRSLTPALAKRLQLLLDSLQALPRRTKFAHPLTGLVEDGVVTRDQVLSIIFSALYIPEISALLPAALAEAEQGNFAPLAALVSSFTKMTEEKIASGMRFSVVCAEDFPRLAAKESPMPEAPEPFGRLFVNEFARSCALWPKGRVPSDFFEPVKSSLPVLILSGGLDPVTPPTQGDEVAQSFPNSLHLVAPNLGHGVSHRGCGPRLVQKFIDAASVKSLDGACLASLPRPTFFQPLRAQPKSVTSEGKHQ